MTCDCHRGCFVAWVGHGTGPWHHGEALDVNTEDRHSLLPLPLLSILFDVIFGCIIIIYFVARKFPKASYKHARRTLSQHKHYLNLRGRMHWSCAYRSYTDDFHKRYWRQRCWLRAGTCQVKREGLWKIREIQWENILLRRGIPDLRFEAREKARANLLKILRR